MTTHARGQEVAVFDGAATQEFQSQLADAYAVTCRERDWIKLHDEITSVGKQIVCLEAREVDLLLEAEETKLYRRMGFPTIYAYIESVLQHSHHVATERMRVAHELLELPGIAEAFRAGELAWTSVRELTRVATGKTEDAWLDAAEGKISTEVQQLVRGKSKGDLPTDPVDPKKIRHRIVLDGISEEGMMLFKQARNAAADARGASCTDDELVRALAAAILEPAGGDHGKPRHQTATTTCRACKQSHRVGAGMEIAVSPAELERVLCDSEDIGDLDREEPGRKLQKSIPAATRRKVFVRDKCRCIVPGCRSTRFLEAHHIRPRSEGGGHELRNLGLLCDAHHVLLHEGVISIRGTAPDHLVFDLPAAHGGD
ncbi:MAG: HNH endonuclease [Myxococcales bacterium]|nr:HNH endonuclease [Myxococcales bacterium]